MKALLIILAVSRVASGQALNGGSGFTAGNFICRPNTIVAGPATGSTSAMVVCRGLTQADLPALSFSFLTGQIGSAQIPSTISSNTTGNAATASIALGFGVATAPENLPATCTVGQADYVVTGTPGVYACSSTNTWTLQGGGGGGGGGAVSSVFGREGAVVATSGDYSFSQISGDVSAAQLPDLNLMPGALNPSQIAQDDASSGNCLVWDGSAWAPGSCVPSGDANANTVFAGPTSGGAAPGQFRALVPADVPTLNQNTTGNAATATALAAIPAQCSGSQFATGVAANGDANCGTPAGGGGGASSANQLTDINPVRTSSTVATGTFSPNGTVFGGPSFSTDLTGALTVTLSSGGAAASTTFYLYWSLASPSSLVIDTSNSSFSGVTLTGVSQGNANAVGYPADVTPLFRLTAGNTSANQWDSWSSCAPNATTGCIDDRAWLGKTVVKAGTDMTSSVTNGVKTISADNTILTQKFFGSGAPGSIAGNLPGDLYSDTTNHNIYQCNAASSTSSPACTSVTSGGWTLLNGGGGGSSTVTPPVISSWTVFGSGCTTNTGTGAFGSYLTVISTAAANACGWSIPVSGNYTHFLTVSWAAQESTGLTGVPIAGVFFSDGTALTTCSQFFAANGFTAFGGQLATVTASYANAASNAPVSTYQNNLVYMLTHSTSGNSCAVSFDGGASYTPGVLTNDTTIATPTVIGFYSNGNGGNVGVVAMLSSYQ